MAGAVPAVGATDHDWLVHMLGAERSAGVVLRFLECFLVCFLLVGWTHYVSSLLFSPRSHVVGPQVLEFFHCVTVLIQCVVRILDSCIHIKYLQTHICAVVTKLYKLLYTVIMMNNIYI